LGLISSFVAKAIVGMKQYKVRIIIFFLFLSIGASAQINHFIYLQTENKQPFYVKLDKTLLSSSSSGYLIIPKLKDGSYKLAVGFPKNEWQEQVFNCTVQQLDAGYLLKNFGEKGWGLFNLQSLDITMAVNLNDVSPNKNDNKTDAFSALLSNVVNDPAILKKEALKKAVVKADASDSIGTITKATVAVVEPPIVNKPISIIRKIEETEAKGEFHLVYLDSTNNKKDSIDILIPANDQKVEKNIAQVPANIEVKEVPVPANNATQLANDKEVQKNNVQQDGVQNTKIDAPKVDIKENLPDTVKKVEQPIKKVIKSKAEKPAKSKAEKFLPMELAPVATDTLANAAKLTTTTATDSITVVKVDSPVAKQNTGIINSDCISNATDEDFLKLRKKMAAASTDEEMMAISKKVLKQKCFSTDQIKNLAVLFLKDAGRYSFFDLSYPFVWDSYNYGSLENQLTEPYFINRFKAMIRH
jgi:hypothetical protein